MYMCTIYYTHTVGMGLGERCLRKRCALLVNPSLLHCAMLPLSLSLSLSLSRSLSLSLPRSSNGAQAFSKLQTLNPQPKPLNPQR